MRAFGRSGRADGTVLAWPGHEYAEHSVGGSGGGLGCIAVHGRWREVLCRVRCCCRSTRVVEPEEAGHGGGLLSDGRGVQCLMKDEAIAGSSMSKAVGRWGVTEADEYSGELHIVFSFMPAWVKRRH